MSGRVSVRSTSPVSWRWPLVAALVFLLAHLFFLAPTLDDIDAVNFAFGVEQFDPALHHPHPPGYPVYILLGKISTAAWRAVERPAAAERLVADTSARALAFWSVVFGALALLAWYALFLQMEILAGTRGGGGGPPERLALCAAAFTAISPLAWFTAARPMSDMPGLAAATLVQALLLAAWRRENEGAAGADARRAPLLEEAFGLPTWAALAAALAVGVRSQVMWLTLPLLAAALVARARRRGLAALVPPVAAYAVGGLLWGVPMLVTTGWQRYLGALGNQGAEDFAGVDMLWGHFGARRLVVGLVQTFVLPWSSIPLAVLVLLLAAVGLAALLRRARVALAMLGLLALPYAIFHTLFHETLTTRYALPLVPAVCYLAVRGVAELRGPAPTQRRAALAGIVGLVLAGWSLGIGSSAVMAYASAPSPLFQAIGEMGRRAARSGEAPTLGMHRRVSTEARPALNWVAAAAPWSRRLPSPRGGEWAQALRLLREEPDATLWFLGEPARRGELRYRDLALVDPRACAVARYDWPFDATGLLDGVRPGSVDLYEIKQPSWIAGPGFALTPETAGVSARDHVGPSYGPIEALVRRRDQEAVVFVGGRHLGTEGDGAARVAVRIDGALVREFLVPVTPRFFLQAWHLPAGALSGTGAFASLTIRATAADGSDRVVPVAVEQFDVQGADRVVAGYAAGWQEPEYDAQRQLGWRWMSEHATVRVHAGGSGPLTLHLTGESPRRYFDRPSIIRVRIGNTELARVVPDPHLPRLFARVTGGSVFRLSVPIRRDLLAAAADEITLEADQFFVPSSVGQNRDQRHLSARIIELRVD